MADGGFDAVCGDIGRMLDRSGKPFRLARYDGAEIACVYGPDASALHRARHGLDHIEEMAYTAAEHHPYYRLLNGITEAARVVLDRWDGTIDAEDADMLRWSLSRMGEALDRMGK